MIKVGHYYMRDNTTMVAQVLQSLRTGTHMVAWYSLSPSKDLLRESTETQEIYMHPDVWADVTDVVLKAELWNS